MPPDPLDSIRLQPGNPIDWSIVRRNAPPIGISTEVNHVVWHDSNSSLSICYVGSDGNGFFRLWQGDEICVDIHSNRCLEVWAADHLLEHSVEHFLADQVIPRAMAGEGMFILHAGGVCVGTDAILFLGKSGRGKSTLVASFDAAGTDLIGDDAMVISRLGQRHQVQSVYPSLRLFRNSIEAVLNEGIVSHAVTQQSSKRRIDIPLASTKASAPRPIAALFTISEPNGTGNIRIRNLSIAETCMSAIENSFLLNPSDVSRARHQLSLASDLAREVPSFELSYPRDFARLPEVRSSILSHISNLH